MDPIIRVWLGFRENQCHKKEQTKYNILKRIIDRNLRISCLSGDKEPYLSPLMWSYYAHNQCGLCIKYEILPSDIRSMNTCDQFLGIGDVRYRTSKIMSDYITLDNSLLAKADCWKNEKETRLIYFSINENKLNDYVSIPGFSIKAVYLGCRVTSDYIKAVRLAIKGRPIDLFKMEYDNYDITKLQAKKL